MVSFVDCLTVGLSKKDHNIGGQLGLDATRARPGRCPEIRNDIPKQVGKFQNLTLLEHLLVCHHLRSGSCLAHRGAN